MIALQHWTQQRNKAIASTSFGVWRGPAIEIRTSKRN
jgi:hypothetical protein